MALVEEPFAVLGYRFESRDLTLRILAYTNYYPSLIQLFCAQLLKYVSEGGARFDRKWTPPWTITSEQVENASHNQELWKQVRDRFQWTLQLDQRYEVIASAIALESRAEPGIALSDGVPVRWIRERVMDFWAKGFQDSSSEEAVRILADEMVGLGLLRSTGQGRYALRNANVLALMGNEDDISAALVRDREPPIEYEAAAFRFSYRTRGVDHYERRNPLTAQQEERFRRPQNEVLVVCGTEAAALSEVPAFVEMLVGEDFFNRLKDNTTAERFSQQLTEAVGRRKEGVTVLYVPAACGWGIEWVARAATKMKQLVRTKQVVKVVFEADPRGVWDMLSSRNDAAVESVRDASGILTLSPWKDSAVRQRLEDDNVRSDPAKRHQLKGATGNWHLLLDGFSAALRRGVAWDAALTLVSEEIGRNPVWWARFGLDVAAPSSVIAQFAPLEEATVADIAAVLETSEADVALAIEWADLLALVQPGAEGRWRIDDVVRRVAEGVSP
jgi:hypothetical protein